MKTKGMQMCGRDIEWDLVGGGHGACDLCNMPRFTESASFSLRTIVLHNYYYFGINIIVFKYFILQFKLKHANYLISVN